MRGGLGILVVGVILIGSMYFFYGARQQARGRETLPVAFGPPAGSTVELNLAVGMNLPRRDPPKLKFAKIQWDQWVDEHFELKDASGAAVKLQRTNFSQLISDQKAGGTPEFFLKATVTPGANYTLDYLPVAGGERFRYAFTAPTAAQEAERAVFQVVEGP